MAPRTSVSCGHLRRGLRPIKKRWSLALCKQACTNIGRLAGCDAAHFRVLQTLQSGAAPHKKKMVIGPLQVHLRGPLTIFFLRGLSLNAKRPRDVLSSQAVAHQVLSALKDFTSVFGMLTGVSPSPSSRDQSCVFIQL